VLCDVGMVGAYAVKEHDPSQMPVEQLAQLLLHLAREDAALPRRTPANDDAEHARYIDDMFNRIEALPELRRDSKPIRLEPHVSSRPVPAAAVASNEDLEELVAIALTSAQDAEDVSREAKEASRKARRGMFVAVGLAIVGVAAAGATVVAVRQSAADSQQMAEIARQVQALNELQQHINDQLAEIHTAVPVQEASAAPARPAQQASIAPPPPPVLAPLKSTPVRVLPAEAAAPLFSRGESEPAVPDTAGSPSRQEAPAPSYAPAASYAPYPPPPVTPAPYVVGSRAWTPYRHRVRHYRVVVMPQPVAFVIGTMRTLFR
jgi:hypothetical protein